MDGLRLLAEATEAGATVEVAGILAEGLLRHRARRAGRLRGPAKGPENPLDDAPRTGTDEAVPMERGGTP